MNIGEWWMMTHDYRVKLKCQSPAQPFYFSQRFCWFWSEVGKRALTNPFLGDLFYTSFKYLLEDVSPFLLGDVEGKLEGDVHYSVASQYLHFFCWVMLPSGKPTKSYGKSPCLMGKSTISMAIFNSYVNVYQRVSINCPLIAIIIH